MRFKTSNLRIARRRWADPSGLAIDLIFGSTALAVVLIWICG